LAATFFVLPSGSWSSLLSCRGGRSLRFRGAVLAPAAGLYITSFPLSREKLNHTGYDRSRR
jgi:hypothetical protein